MICDNTICIYNTKSKCKLKDVEYNADTNSCKDPELPF